MENYEIVLLSEGQQLHTVVKVKDQVFNHKTLDAHISWLWIDAETSEFCPFELWKQFDEAFVNQIFDMHETIFTAIQVKAALIIDILYN